jgi:hypothetical protein
MALMGRGFAARLIFALQRKSNRDAVELSRAPLSAERLASGRFDLDWGCESGDILKLERREIRSPRTQQ